MSNFMKNWQAGLRLKRADRHVDKRCGCDGPVFVRGPPTRRANDTVAQSENAWP